MVGNARPTKTYKLSSASLRLCEKYFFSPLLAVSRYLLIVHGLQRQPAIEFSHQLIKPGFFQRGKRLYAGIDTGIFQQFLGFQLAVLLCAAFDLVCFG